MLFDSDKNDLTALINRQPNVNEDVDTRESVTILPVGSTVVVHHKDGDFECMEQQLNMDEKTIMTEAIR